MDPKTPITEIQSIRHLTQQVNHSTCDRWNNLPAQMHSLQQHPNQTETLNGPTQSCIQRNRPKITHTYTQAHAKKHTHTHTCMHARARTHTHTHTRMHAHTTPIETHANTFTTDPWTSKPSQRWHQLVYQHTGDRGKRWDDPQNHASFPHPLSIGQVLDSPSWRLPCDKSEATK